MKDKGNDGKGDNPERDLWETEQSFWDSINEQYKFTFDCCASFQNKKTPLYTDNFLNVDKIRMSHHTCWMNPPFSKAKEMFEHFFKVVKKGVAIYRFDNPETKVWQDIIFPNASWIFIPKGRVSYTPFDINMRNGLGTRFPSALIGYNVSELKELSGILIKTDLKRSEGFSSNEGVELTHNEIKNSLC